MPPWSRTPQTRKQTHPDADIDRVQSGQGMTDVQGTPETIDHLYRDPENDSVHMCVPH